MAILSRTTLLAGVLVVAIVGCSNDNTPADGGTPDTTPPAVTSITPVDAFHIDVTFNENLRRETAEQENNYVILEGILASASRTESASPGDTLHVATASLNSDNRTVSITTEGPMTAVPYDMSITGVADAGGNRITNPVVSSFTGTTNADTTPPEIVYQSPAPDATGVGVAAPVVFQFSEPVDYLSVVNGVSWTKTGGSVPYQLDFDGETGFSLTPLDPMDTGTRYTVSLTGVQDPSSNTMPVTTWSYTTTSIVDTTPPRLISSIPADHATNVNVDANLSLTFSEAINPVTFGVDISPDVGDGVASWSNSGRTVTFDPDLPLATNQQYHAAILPGAVQDLSGNGNVEVVDLVFTTANALATGSFAGTISGDPGSAFAGDPTGALVIAPTSSPFAGGGNFDIMGSDVVAGNNTYDIRYLPDAFYYPTAAMNTNGEDGIDPSRGDAIGAYGLNFGTGDTEPDSIVITGGNRVIGVNFRLYDPSAIVGSITYDGTYAGGFYSLYIGVFDTTAFDPNSQPAYATQAYWPDYVEWGFDTFEDGLADGTYYVGAFLDADDSGNYDPGVDPAGIFGGIMPTPLHVENGSDILDVVLVLQDPVGPLSSRRVAWPVDSNRAPWFQRLSEIVRENARETNAPMREPHPRK